VQSFKAGRNPRPEIRKWLRMWQSPPVIGSFRRRSGRRCRPRTLPSRWTKSVNARRVYGTTSTVWVPFGQGPDAFLPSKAVSHSCRFHGSIARCMPKPAFRQTPQPDHLLLFGRKRLQNPHSFVANVRFDHRIDGRTHPAVHASPPACGAWIETFVARTRPRPIALLTPGHRTPYTLADISA
jgi:hypothetical protein